MGLKVNMSIKKDTIFTNLIGELDESNASNLKNKIVEVSELYNIKNIVFNLKELTFMDSSGIGFIIGRYNYVNNKFGKIVLCDLNPNISRIVKLSGLHQICSVIGSEESAKIDLGVI